MYESDLLLGKILASGEVLRELARAELNRVSPRKVCVGCCQPLLVIQFLLHQEFENNTDSKVFLEKNVRMLC